MQPMLVQPGNRQVNIIQQVVSNDPLELRKVHMIIATTTMTNGPQNSEI